MKITYDREVDALRIIFRDTTVTTRHITDGISADFDRAGNLAGIEILDARQQFGDIGPLRSVVLEGVGPEA